MPSKEIKKGEKKAKAAYLKFASTSEGKQRFITFICYALVLAVSVLSSVLQVIFGFENFDLTRFITNLCINSAVSIITMILAMRDGKLSGENAKEGDYYESKMTFKSVLKKIVSRDFFRQFCDVLFNREREEYVMNILARVNIYDDVYLRISNEDFEKLKTIPCVCIYKDKDNKEVKKPLDVLSELQYEALKKYRGGKYHFPKLEYTYFTSTGYKNNYAYQANLQKRQQSIEVWAIVYRLLLVLILSAVFSLIIINPNNGANYVKQAIIDTTTRLLNFGSSIFFGYVIANDQIKEKTESLLFKVDIINQYEDERATGAFVPKSSDEVVMEKIKALEEQRKREQEELEKAKANIIYPEVLNPIKEIEAPKEDEEIIEVDKAVFDALNTLNQK